METARRHGVDPAIERLDELRDSPSRRYVETAPGCAEDGGVLAPRRQGLDLDAAERLQLLEQADDRRDRQPGSVPFEVLDHEQVDRRFADGTEELERRSLIAEERDRGLDEDAGRTAGHRELGEGPDGRGIVGARPDDDRHERRGLLEDSPRDRQPLARRKVGDLAGNDRVEQTVDSGRQAIGDPSMEAVEIDPVVVVERSLGDRDDAGQRVQVLHRAEHQDILYDESLHRRPGPTVVRAAHRRAGW